jgi:hypothetical protein
MKAIGLLLREAAIGLLHSEAVESQMSQDQAHSSLNSSCQVSKGKMAIQILYLKI